MNSSRKVQYVWCADQSHVQEKTKSPPRLVKTAFVSLLLAVWQPLLVAQGTLIFANDESTLIYGRPGSLVAVPQSGGFVQLLWAPAGSSFEAYTSGSLTSWLAANPVWNVLESSTRFIGPLAGRFDAGVVTVPTATPGAVIDAAVACWLGNYASFDAAVAAGANANISPEFTVDTGNPDAQPQPEPPASILGPGQFAGMVVVVPEPSSLTLVLLVSALYVARRKLAV